MKFRGWNGKRMTREYTLQDMLVQQLEHNGLKDNWMQFTGLHDKNGKEIYEGDVLRVGVIEKTKQNREVVYENGAFFTLVPADKKMVSSDHLVAYYSKEEIEIIGNIYENPELLKA